jgi:uncharacterized OB-fold protein
METAPFNLASFYDFLRQKRLMGTRCTSCGRVWLPPRAICAQCRVSRMEWIELPGNGRLVAFTSIYVAPSKLAAQGYDRQHPYCVGVVELENGVRASARILGVDAAHPETIRIGALLRVEFPSGGQTNEVFLTFRAMEQ